MQQTRWAILQILKRIRSSTVEELAHALSLAPMTVRQHLAILERDGLITYRESRTGPGRPPHLYSLSEQAEDLFPKTYHKLAERLLREISLLSGAEIARLSEQEKVALILQRMAARVAEEYEEEIQGDTLEERVDAVITLLREREGTLSEWTRTETGLQIQDINCPFQRVASEQPELCAWHMHLLERMLHAEIDMESCMAQGDGCCLYRVQPASSPPEQQIPLPFVPAPAFLRAHRK